MIEDDIVNRTEKAYFAGIIDGEGTVTLTRRHRNQTHSPEISVANTNLDLLVWLKEKSGGGIILKKQLRSDRHNQAYTWKLQNDRALRLLEEVKGFLMIKKPHVDLILKHYKRLTPRNGKYSQAMLQKKMWLVAKIQELNSR